MEIKANQVALTKQPASKAGEIALENLPPEILDLIDDFLSLSSSANLSSTSQFFRSMFFTLGLKPNCRNALPDQTFKDQCTVRSDIFLFIGKAANFFRAQPVKPCIPHQTRFNHFVDDRKLKYWLYDQAGREHLTLARLNGPLIRSKIATGDWTEKEVLSNRAKLKEEIRLRLTGPLTDQAKRNLNSRGIQDCILVGLFTLSEAEQLSASERNAYALPCVQVALAKKQVTRQELTPALFRALEHLDVREAITKGYVTIKEANHYPNHMFFLSCNRFILDAVLKRKIKKADVFTWNEQQMAALCLPWVGDVIWTKKEINPDASICFHDLFMKPVPLELVLSRAELLLEMEEMHRQFDDSGLSGVTGYLQYQWGDRLTVQRCIDADPQIISSLLLSDNRYLLESMVQEKLSSIDDLLKLTLQQIQLLYQESVQQDLRSGILTIQDVRRYTGDLSVDHFLNSIRNSIRA